MVVGIRIGTMAMSCRDKMVGYFYKYLNMITFLFLDVGTLSP